MLGPTCTTPRLVGDGSGNPIVDCHAEGESGQVVVGGVPPIPGETVFEKRVFLQDQSDDLRRMILFEPRGAPHHNANILVPSNHPDAQMGYVILESTEYPAMSGSNTRDSNSSAVAASWTTIPNSKSR